MIFELCLFFLGFSDVIRKGILFFWELTVAVVWSLVNKPIVLFPVVITAVTNLRLTTSHSSYFFLELNNMSCSFTVFVGSFS